MANSFDFPPMETFKGRMVILCLPFFEATKYGADQGTALFIRNWPYLWLIMHTMFAT